MADFSVLNCQYNTGSDGTPTWTGTALAFGGTSGANELRFASSANPGGTGVASASWPYATKPASGTSALDQLYAFTADTTGSQVATYDGTNGKARVLRWNWDNSGTFASAPQFSAFSSTSHTTPTAGDNSIVGGNASDTSSTSYIKGNAYGQGGASTPAAGSAGTTLAATSGAAGSVSPGASAWLATWQSLQGWVQYILNGAIPAAVTAGNWYWTVVFYLGANMTTGTFTFVFTFQYSYS